MAYFRIHARDGTADSVFHERATSEALLRDQLAKRGWTVVSIEQADEPEAPLPSPPEPSPAIRPDQMRAAGSWIYLPPHIAKQHPLYGIGGWTALLLASMVLSGLLAIWLLVAMAKYLFFGDWFLALFIFLAVIQIINIAAIVLLVTRSTAFIYVFVVLSTVSITAFILDAAAGDPILQEVGRVAVVLAWTAYVLVSRRTNVTFRNRVERDDDWLKRGLAASATANASTSPLPAG